MNKLEQNMRISFDPLYADEATRPVIHALVAAVGYINGQSIHSATVLTETIKVGIKALEQLTSQKRDMKAAILDASTDIAHWIQLAERQYAEMPDADHNPLAPTTAGIETSKRLRERIVKVALAPASQEAQP